MQALNEIYDPKYGRIIIDSLSLRLKKLGHALEIASQEKGQGPTLDIIIKKLAKSTEENSQGALEMFKELAEEEPTREIYPPTIIKLLNVKIREVKRVQEVMVR